MKFSTSLLMGAGFPFETSVYKIQAFVPGTEWRPWWWGVKKISLQIECLHASLIYNSQPTIAWACIHVHFSWIKKMFQGHFGLKEVIFWGLGSCRLPTLLRCLAGHGVVLLYSRVWPNVQRWLVWHCNPMTWRMLWRQGVIMLYWWNSLKWTDINISLSLVQKGDQQLLHP